MDSWFLAGSLYNIYATKIVLKAGRFLYRAYEIALYSEKYFKEINWNDVEEDIRHQKLCLVFKKMMRDILEIFPNAFPDSFAQMILQLEYVDAEEQEKLQADMRQVIRFSHIESITQEQVDTFIRKIYVYKDKRVEIEWNFKKNGIWAS